MSQAKDARPSGYGQIRLFDSDGDPVNLEAAPPRRTYGPGIFRRIGMLLGYIAFCAGAFLVVGHYRSSGSSHHLPPARDLCVPQASSRLHPEDLVYEDDPLSSLLTKSGNCTTPREEQWVFIDAEGCGHSFTRGAERFQSSASTSFTLPVRDKEAIQLSSRGNARMAGVAHIALAEDITQEDVQIDVTMYMHDKELFEKTVKVCRATGPLALFGERLSLHANFPKWTVREPSHSMFMDMMIRLPRGTASSPLRIPSFSLTLSGVDIIVDDLTDGVILDVIQLVSDKAFITVDSVNAGQALVHTSEGAIRGAFNVSGDLTLTTSDAPIELNATLTASSETHSQPRLFDVIVSQNATSNATHASNLTELEPSDTGSQTWSLFDLFSLGDGGNVTRPSNNLNLKTTNAGIASKIVLSAPEHGLTDSEAAEGHYSADIRTTNAPIDVAFSSLPGGRQLKAAIITQFANATVTLPPNFSGPVCVQSHSVPWTEPIVHDGMYGGLTAEERGIQFVNKHGDGGMSACAEVEKMSGYARMTVPHGVIDVHA